MTRAQEAEENYVIKRELAVVRQQFSVTSQNLEKAQDTIGELQREKVRNDLESVWVRYWDGAGTELKSGFDEQCTRLRLSLRDYEQNDQIQVYCNG